MAEQVRVFVSHHHSAEEDAFTANLVADLEADGADVWVDTAGISSGSFVAKISEGLAGRQWLVLIMTPAALASSWVRAEVEAALQEVHAGRMLGVIPLVMQPCHDQDLPILWRTLQRYDATRDYQGAVDGLLRALRAPAPAAHPAPPPSTPAQPIIPPIRFPPRLASLGYQARVLGGVEVIFPPLCQVPPRPFTMGSDKRRDRQAFDDETPQHVIAVGAYQIAAFPVTVAEYACAVRAEALREPPKGVASPIEWNKQVQRLDHPVVCISWQDAVAYAAWLVRLTGQPWWLPSEAEWEKAARGADGRIYPWGNQWDKARANTKDGGPGATTPVGAYADRGDASPYGVHDLAGNVLEWTSSLYKPYPYTYTRYDGREQPDSTGDRVLRGGTWNGGPRYARAAVRNGLTPDPDDVANFAGFRLVAAAPGPA